MLARDKALHFVGGFLIGLTVAPFFGISAMIPVALAGFGKELYDNISKKGTPELLDAVATIAGGAVAVIIVEVCR